MFSKFIAATALSLTLFSFLTASAQSPESYYMSEEVEMPEFLEQYEEVDSSHIYAPDGRRWEDIPAHEAVGFALDTIVELPPIPAYFFMPAVYDHFEFPDTVRFDDRMFSGRPELRWIEELNVVQRNMNMMRYSLFFDNPQLVKYNVAMLPQAPKFYETEVNPLDHTISIRETITGPSSQTTLVADKLKKRHWIRNFSASLQFSQAYVSPNWYQGGNDNLNLLGQLFYNVKLNEQFHPNLLVEFTSQYKLGLNNAPDDSLRNYSISEDLLQLNGKIGIKAAKRWYYSFTGQFKTQLLNSYTSNTRNLRSAFLAPGEFIGGFGMTYNYANTKKTFTFDASIDPISYKLMICTNEHIDETIYGIKEGHTTLSKYGCSSELNMYWQMASNISLRSHFTLFSDFSNAQADWQNTLQFDINRFLTTKVFADLRYDTRGVAAYGTKWKKLQLKELLSIGFTYRFSSI